MYSFRSKKPALLLIIMMLPTLVSAASVYETQAEFLNRAFGDSPPAPDLIWLSGEKKSTVREILGHDYAALRLRYWCAAGRTAWVVEEIGKELPITVGVIIKDDYIESLRVLTYRENRGEEVVTPSFSDQFINTSINSSGLLDTHIDGISGATLSVQALTRLATMTLYLNSESGCQNGT